MGALPAYEEYTSLVSGNGRIFALHVGADNARVHLVSWNNAGQDARDTDLVALLPSGMTVNDPDREPALTMGPDGTLWVSLSARQGNLRRAVLLHVNDTGTVVHAPVVLPDLGSNTTYLGRVAVGLDDVVYAVVMYSGQYARLHAVAPWGQPIWNVVLGTTRYSNAGEAPSVGYPFIASDGTVQVLVRGASRMGVQTIDPALPVRRDPVEIVGPQYWQDVGPVSLPDGSLILGGYSSGTMSVTRYSPTGSVVWTTPYEAATTFEGGNPGFPVSGKGEDLLLAWGNAVDTTGSGYHVIQRNGVAAQTFRGAVGDGLAVLGTDEGTVILLVQNQLEPTQGPLVMEFDRLTGMRTSWTAQLRCATENAPSGTAELSVLSDGRLVVACRESPDAVGRGGLYALDKVVTLPPLSPWPLPHGSPRASRRTVGSTFIAASGGSSPPSSSSSGSSSGSGTWLCDPSWRGTRDGCDCGCGAVDPDCAGGCTQPGCSAPGCTYCYDAQQQQIACQ